MGIEKNSFKASRFDPEYHLSHSRDTIMSSDDDFQRRNSVSAVESDDDDEFDDCDSGAGSDDFDLLELGESGEEFCQVGDQTCSIPYDLYDLSGLKDVLSMEVWNEVLTEEERFSLAKHLPDMDQENFVHTLKELFGGNNLHFGSPVDKLFEMLKGGLCEPRVALYRQGLSFFQRRQHYHNLRKHHNAMINNLCQIRDAWLNCKGYSIDEKLRVLNIMKSQKSLMNENMEELGSESSDREESGDGLWGKKGKDQKLGQKTGRYSGYGMGPTSDFSSHGRQIAMEPAKRGKQNPKGTLKLTDSKSTSTRELAGRLPTSHQGLEMKMGPYISPLPPSRHNKAAGFASSVAGRMTQQIMEDEDDDDDDDEEAMYEVAVQRDRNFPRVGATDKAGASKLGKKRDNPRTEEYTDSFIGAPMSSKNDLHVFGRNKTINQLSDIKVLTTKPVNARSAFEYGKKMKYTDNVQQFSGENQMKFTEGQKSNLSLKGSQVELLDGSEQLWLSKQHGVPFPADFSYKQNDMSAKNKKWKTGKDSADVKASEKLLHSKYKAKPVEEKFQGNFMLNGVRDVAGSRGIRAFPRSEETESDSSEQIDDEEDDNPLMRRKWAYSGGVTDLKYGPDIKKVKISKKDKKDRFLALDGSSHSSKKIDDSGEHLWMMKEELKGKMRDSGHLNTFSTKDLDKDYFPEPGGLTGRGDWQQSFKLARNGHLEEDNGERFRMPSLKSSLPVERRLKGETGRDFGVPQSNYMQDFDLEKDDLLWTRPLAVDNGVLFKLGKKGQMVEPYTGDHERDVSIMGCNTLPKKRKMKDDLTYVDHNNEYLQSDTQLQLDGSSSLKKRGKNKLEDVSDALQKGVTKIPTMDMQVEDVEAETKQQKKPFTLITPTVHTGFSISIIHLLSAVRMAMITLLPEDSSDAGKDLDKNDPGKGIEEEQDIKQEHTNGMHSNANLDVSTSVPSGQVNVPSLSVQEIVNRVRSNPGDPCILETQEPLQDLVRGVLKIFSSRTAPLGAKGWKPLVVYEKSKKCWSWIGPVSHNSSDHEAVEEVTSADAWGLPHKMLVKLVDSFANWLKNSQDTLQQIGSLPAPPVTLLQSNLDEKERFKDLRAQKSLITISPSSEEVREYFRKEEVLRYLIPDRAFSYTAVDGKKTIVAPLRRCGGKPTSKARDHFMLKRDRPPHVTILCLVRDAAARLPGSIGTRADVCTLIRDSQYIVEDVSDAQVNQVVSGALDRLHYERDPCVQFDGERKLWVYLHRDREEEDFEDDGTSSTKKWRRQKKDATEPSDQGDVTVAYAGHVEQPGFDLVSDLNVEASCADDDKGSELVYPNGNDQVDNVETSHGSEHGDLHHGPSPMIWDGLGLSSMQENKLLCQENSTNEDFGDDQFGGEPPA
ncbi:hypothetical protein Adt_31315 [Abeliophyllum distichum]|uniref:DEUBAD domain-containing protein n=1 Tax=Abeliophyllum distichum TaxID=126358 RepID=A0ABD1RDQ3_9LAMI